MFLNIGANGTFKEIMEKYTFQEHVVIAIKLMVNGFYFRKFRYINSIKYKGNMRVYTKYVIYLSTPVA